MTISIRNILHQATKKENDKLNILCSPTHERYEGNLACTNAEFYAYRAQGIKDWNKNFGPLPNNYHLLPYYDNNGDLLKTLPIYVNFDFILCQSKMGQYQYHKNLSKLMGLPLLVLEHTLPSKEWEPQNLSKLKEMKGDINIFISEYSRSKWGWTEKEAEVIYHGIDTEIFKPLNLPRKQHVLSVVNDWVNRDWCCGFRLWQASTQGLPVRTVGDTPGLSLPASSLEDLVNEYNSSQVFINTSLISPIPTSLLEAAACGCAIISTNNCAIPELIKHGENGFLANDPAEINYYAKELLLHPDLCIEFGMKARQSVLEKFNKETFVKKWDQIFNRASNIVYKG